MLDAPVSGSVITLEQGQLSLMVGGDQAAYEQVRPVLLDIGPKVNYVGSNGQAVLMKIAINLNLQVQMLAFCEGLLLAEKGGIPRETALEVMLNSVIASPSLLLTGEPLQRCVRACASPFPQGVSGKGEGSHVRIMPRRETRNPLT